MCKKAPQNPEIKYTIEESKKRKRMIYNDFITFLQKGKKRKKKRT